MKRGLVVVSLASMLVVVGTVNYQLSKNSLMETSKEFKEYEQAQLEKNSDDIIVVDSNVNEVEEKVTEASKQIEAEINSEENIIKSTYILDMKMTREKQRSDLSVELNDMINNPSTAEETRTEASAMKLQIVKDQETELRIESILSTKGFENSLVYINEGRVNVVVSNMDIKDEDAAKIFDVVSKEAEVSYSDIQLSNNNQ